MTGQQFATGSRATNEDGLVLPFRWYGEERAGGLREVAEGGGQD